MDTPAVEACPFVPHKFYSLEYVRKETGLSRAVLNQLCSERKLKFVTTGKKKKHRKIGGYSAMKLAGYEAPAVVVPSLPPTDTPTQREKRGNRIMDKHFPPTKAKKE